jgi:hypothetical protein
VARLLVSMVVALVEVRSPEILMLFVLFCSVTQVVFKFEF